MKVINLVTLEEHHYGDIPAITAVCQSYCNDNSLGSWFYAMLHSGMRFTDTLPLTIGKQTVACGDWCAISD